MAGNERFEDAIGGWLEESAPRQLPQRVLGATFERTRRAQQEPAWRTVLGSIAMPRFIPAVGGVAVLVATAVVALNLGSIASPDASPNASASAPATAAPSAEPISPSSPSPSAMPTLGISPALDGSFTSAMHGLSLAVPAGWRTRPAFEAWTGGVLAFDHPGADVIYHPNLGEGLYLIVASQSLGAAQEPALTVGTLCLAPGRNEPAGSVDGVQAYAQSCRAAEVATFATETRAWLVAVIVTSNPPRGDHYDYWWLRSVLDTAEIDPESPS